MNRDKITLRRNRAVNAHCIWVVYQPRFFDPSTSHCFMSWREAHFFMVGLVNGLAPHSIRQMMRLAMVA